MAEEIKKLGVKLAEACNEVGGVAKKGRNAAQGYDFVRAADVAKAIRHELFKRGIVVIPNEVECTTKQITFLNAKGENRCSNEVMLKTAYTITDGTETLVMHGYGIAWDAGDKAIYKAKTGALKYFLRGLGLIPDEKDDPEASDTLDRAAAKETNDDFDQRTEAQQAINLFQIQGFDEACKRTKKSEEEIAAFLGLIGHKRIEHILKSEFQQALKWANSTAKSGTAAAKAILQPANGNLVKSFDHAWPKLWGRAKEIGVTQEDVKQYYREVHKVEHGNQLTPLQFKDVCEWLESVKV
jgi:hypothetical protein